MSGARLVVVDGALKGQSLALGDRVLSIGRQESNDLQLRDAAVSRRHCRIEPVDGGFELYDLGSTQGCFVNRWPVTRHRLADGDLVQIGATALIFLHQSSRGAELELCQLTDGGSTVERSPEQIARLLRGGGRSRGADADPGFLLRLATAAQELRSPQALVQRLLDLVIEALPLKRGAVLRLEPGGEHRPRTWVSQGAGPAETSTAETSTAETSTADAVAPSRTLLSRVVEGRTAVWWDAARPGSGLPATESLLAGRVRSVLAAPIAGRRDLHGVLYLEMDGLERDGLERDGLERDGLESGGAVTETHLELAATAAALTGLALDTIQVMGDLREENRRLRGGAHGLVGESPAMEKLQDFIARVAPVDSTVLLLGESGTGKELVASALHGASPRADQPFVAINCATLSESLLESELFGHERGAFTGAMTRKIGKFEAADRGTIFLDEIGEMPTTVQARLLRALQERRFERVGGTRPIDVDVRVIAATHRNLESAIGEGTFREDLFYRLNVITCPLPPLRERREDIALLARHFVQRLGERLGRGLGPAGASIDAKALRALQAYDWPGNIRQLSNAIERALVLGDGECIRPEDLPDEILDRVPPEQVELGDYQSVITETKKRLLIGALEEAGGNAAEAGRRLGLHPNSFRRLRRQLGLRDT